ncbi:MAG: VCBS repeat-containing protein [Planctomycetes bacterium]|nr:VCBS repeat-containing protein [Planctomycetota bacterium]
MATDESTGAGRSRSRRARWWCVSLSCGLLACGLLAALAFVFFPRTQPRSPGPPELSPPGPAFSPIAGLADRRVDDAVEAELDRLDPASDGWDTEAFSERAAAQLKELGKLISHQDAPATGQLEGLLDETFTSSPLRPSGLKTVRSDPTWVVLRTAEEKAPGDGQGVLRGPRAFPDALASLRAPLAPGELPAIRVSFKVFHVEPGETSIQTRAFFQLAARAAARSLQQNAVWTCQWKRRQDGSPPLLQSIRVSDYEEIVTNAEQGTLFADCTAAVLGGNASYLEQIIYPLDHWRDILDWRFGLDFIGSHGLAVGDVNGDGLEDLFFCETGGLPNRLFVQQPDGTARDVSQESGVSYLEPTHSALLVDLDNDSDQDLVLASGRFILFLENDGSGRFERRRIHSSASVARSMAAADFDRDGALDVYVCGYFPRETAADSVGLGRPVPYHDANNGGRSYLLASRGSWTFEDVTETVGLEINNRRFSYAAAWEDYDGDGDLDLYVANDFGRNNLYRNDGGRFVDVADRAGVEDIAAGMSASWGDFNRDGLVDLYVGNMFSSAGQRITYQRRFKEGVSESTRASYQRHARGNSLFENAGDGTFRDVSLEAGVTMGRWAWSSNFVDIDGDGWEDIVVANGMVTSPEDPGDL